MKIISAITAILLLNLSACASMHDPIVDPKHTNLNNYEKDLAECHVLADKVDVVRDTVLGTAVGSATGGAGGAAIGALHGKAGHGALALGVIGAFVGTGMGYSAVYDRQVDIIDNCLKGRGYKILG